MEEDTGKSVHIGSGRIDSATSTLLELIDQYSISSCN